MSTSCDINLPVENAPLGLCADLLFDATELLVMGLSYGMHFVLICVTIPVLLRSKTGNPNAKRALLIAIASMFVLASAVTALDVAYDILDIKYVSNDPNDDRMSTFLGALFDIETAIFGFNILLGDCIVMWRAWMILSDNRKIAYCSLLFLAGVGGSRIWIVVALSLRHDSNPSTATMFVLSTLMNISATAAIAHKLWVNRRFVRQHIGEERKEGRPLMILILIFETGAIYSLLWIVGGVITVNAGFRPLRLIDDLIGTAGRGIVSIYPTVLVLTILLYGSLWDLYGEETQMSTIELQRSEQSEPP
ncbi:hypothetical protein VNI00_010909 [Paramarasmius palmivorus]|uniref:Uncharacterized protein n=1 Tax=Paramarasmius palmivorus TaxID=297713 RepID=A0AAW0CF19_9AGAR